MASSRSLNPQGKRSGYRRAGGRTTGKKSLDIPKLRQRLVIENVRPDVDGGRFLSKGVVGEAISVEADIYSHGHDELAADLLYRHESESEWHRGPMQLVVVDEDRWRFEFNANERGIYLFTIEAWIDPYARWRRDFAVMAAAGEASDLDLQIGALLLNQVAERASGPGRRALANAAERLQADSADATNIALDQGLAREARNWRDPLLVARYERELSVLVEGKKAAFSAWYEMFPRSASPDPGRPGTFRDVEARLDYVAGMGFDVLYLPPIHPIGAAYRKGPNSSLNARAGDPGSPWAIGSKAGGHKSINPDLGTMTDFRRLVQAAKRKGLDIALDIAFQCSPDHPYVTEHPEWFRKRPDGSIQYAENPPKKYQDVYPFDFETEARESLWEELKSIFLFWIEEGVSFFRVDNPHTKPFAFWEWCIAEVRRADPDVVFKGALHENLSCIVCPSLIQQSYTYFAWRNTKRELTDYFTELAHGPGREYFRPNVWPNTPDILTEQMWRGERATFISRLVLAATLSPSYGIYNLA
jgi:starch synthase (maltosyl-transferring)